MRRFHGSSRFAQGMTLLEMLFSVSIVGLAAAGISGLVMLNSISSVRLFNKIDNLNAARQIVERIGMDVRMARNVGDVYGMTSAIPGYTEATDQFPLQSPSGKNPLYNSGQMPPAQYGGAFPSSPWPNKPYRLSSQCLIVQVPVFDQFGFPTTVTANQYGAGNPAVNSDNVDTLVYQLVPDPDNAGEFMLQGACFPGRLVWGPGCLNSPFLSSPPQTLIKGIVGPMDDDPSDTPRVFQFLDRTDVSGTPINEQQISTATLTNITGVIINMELKRQDREKTQASTIGIRSEIFMRNNKLSTTSPPN
jgi:prepilin-type N-terminal cleavage/methylation domain-containing protein